MGRFLLIIIVRSVKNREIINLVIQKLMILLACVGESQNQRVPQPLIEMLEKRRVLLLGPLPLLMQLLLKIRRCSEWFLKHEIRLFCIGMEKMRDQTEKKAEQNHPEAKLKIAQAAQLGNVEAFGRLCKAKLKGKDQNDPEAIKWTSALEEMFGEEKAKSLS